MAKKNENLENFKVAQLAKNVQKPNSGKRGDQCTTHKATKNHFRWKHRVVSLSPVSVVCCPHSRQFFVVTWIILASLHPLIFPEC